MKEVSLDNLKEGMIVSENVMTKNGQCILEKGKPLNRQIIMRLSFYNISSIMVEVEDEPEAEPEDTEAPKKLKPKSAAAVFKAAPVKAVPETPEHAQRVSQKIQDSQKSQALQIEHIIALSNIKTCFEEFVAKKTPLDTSKLLATVIERFNSCTTSADLFKMLHSMHSTEDSIYGHCLNVALICRQIGKWMRFDDAALDTLTLCGVLHDIGKLKIPEEILNKPGKYTDEEFDLVKRHTQYGYDLLHPLNIDDRIKKAARSHHERCDGSGYPSGLRGDDTNDFATIVAIADVYDAMTTARSYRAPLCPFQVIASFEKDGLQKYNPKYILKFLEKIAGIYQNHRVLLSDGRSATIVMPSASSLSKPIVQLDDNTIIDLSSKSDLIIQTVL